MFSLSLSLEKEWCLTIVPACAFVLGWPEQWLRVAGEGRCSNVPDILFLEITFYSENLLKDALS